MVARGTRLAVRAGMSITVTLTFPDATTWNAIRLMAAEAAERHARRTRHHPAVAGRFELAAAELLGGTTQAVCSTPGATQVAT